MIAVSSKWQNVERVLSHSVTRIQEKHQADRLIQCSNSCRTSWQDREKSHPAATKIDQSPKRQTGKDSSRTWHKILNKEHCRFFLHPHCTVRPHLLGFARQIKVRQGSLLRKCCKRRSEAQLLMCSCFTNGELTVCETGPK